MSLRYNYLMKIKRNSWNDYSIGLFIVWATILLLSWTFKSAANFDTIFLVFLGFLIGWLAATIKLGLMNKKSWFQ